jgi:Flp pilus assembly protein TadD
MALNTRLIQYALCGLLAAGWVGAGGAAPSPPSVSNLLTSYVAWVQNRAATVPLMSVDLDAARNELNRIAPTFLMPLEGKVAGLRGSCPTLNFTVAGAAVFTNATTQYEQIACAQIANGLPIRLIRQVNASLAAARISEPISDGTAIPDERQRRLLTAFALELAKTGSDRQAAAAARLVEWACPYVRAHAPVNDFDHAWQWAALAILEGGIDGHALAAHLDHVKATFGDDPRMALARGIAEEQLTAPVEALSGQTEMLDAARAKSLLSREAERTVASERAITRFRDAAQEPAVSAEAALRLGHVQLEMHRAEAAIGSWTSLEAHTTDPALLYLVHLFRGLALEGLGRSGEARASYVQALALSPGAHSATMRLATLAFRNGQGDEAGRLTHALLQDDNPQTDPWWSYYAGDWRFWYPNIERVRTLTK